MAIRITIIGSGNVAFHLGKAIKQAGHTIQGVHSRNKRTGKELAKLLNAEFVADISDLTDSDICIVAVSDYEVFKVAQRLSHLNCIVAHTSGSIGLGEGILDRKRFGYFYPLQTFRKEMEVDMKSTPLFVHARLKKDTETLKRLGDKVSDVCVIMDENKKAKLHLSAVIVNNFVNHLFALTKDYLDRNELDYKYLEPIINTTVKRAMAEDPAKIQTGPAIRDDETTINKHLEQLDEFARLKEVYAALTKNIQKLHLKDD